MNKQHVFFFLFSLMFVYPSITEAYIDPGTGSLIVQAIIAAFFGVVMYLKLSWGRLKAFFHFDLMQKSSEQKEEDAGK